MTEHLSNSISIHAPAKGATASRRATGALQTEFQSTLPRRERHPASHSGVNFVRDFNPRSREGSDPKEYGMLDAIRIFQSTLPRRERLCGKPFAGGTASFQSTLPRRERPNTPRKFPSFLNFNPRSREGSDAALFSPTFSPISISIHAPAKGATCVVCNFSRLCGFQSTLPRRERPEVRMVRPARMTNFNPRSREGSDLNTLMS